MGNQGLIKFIDPLSYEETQFTHFEPYDAHMVYPCFDQPDIKSFFAFTTVSPAEWTVISNENYIEKYETNEYSPLELAQYFPNATIPAKMVIQKFSPTMKISSYLTAVVAGNFKIYEDKYNTVPLRFLVRYSQAYLVESRIPEFFRVTKQGFKFFESFFNIKYAFSKYDQVFVPGMLFGGMENVGCVTLSEVSLRQPTIGAQKFGHDTLVYSLLHELCHHWFGDLVTLKWWEDLWLNEGFASYMGYYCIDKGEGFDDYRLSMLQFYMQKYVAYGTDERKASHPIVMEMKNTGATKDLFDNITYNKGAAVLAQLLAIVGESAFKEGLHIYLSKYQFSNAELADLLNSIQIAATKQKIDIDITYWAEQWLHTAGTCVFKPLYKSEDGKITEFIVQQVSLGGTEEYYRTHLIDIALCYGEEFKVEVIENCMLEATELVNIEKIIGKQAPDAVILNYNDKTYGLTQFDENSIKYLKSHIHKMSNPFARYLVASSCSWMTSNGLLSKEDYKAFHPYMGLLQK